MGEATLVECPHCGDITEQDVVLADLTCGKCDRPFSTQPTPPTYIVAGEWKDAEWIELSRNAARPMSDAELRRLIAGPRRHPFGPEAWQVMRGGDTLIYPNRESAGG